VRFHFVAALLLAWLACDASRPGERSVVVPLAPASGGVPPVLLPATATSASAPPEECTGSDVGDAIAARVLPLGAAGFCIDGASTKTYGKDAKYGMNDVCATLLDGECEIYVKLGVERIVSARYVSQSSSANAIHVVLSRFARAEDAQRVCALRLSDGAWKPMAGGTSIWIGTSTAIVCVRDFMAELSLIAEDPGVTEVDVARMNATAGAALAARIDERLRVPR
jgi:hypothetical protein